MELDLEAGIAVDAKRRIGNYVLGIDESWRLWKIRSTVDGKPIPSALSGRWTDPAEFAAALADYERKVGDRGSA